ncbi:MAG: SGNH/GDSL hydrolase family protein [Bacteroidaceae bacterium]|nr:SGNH/GDSL hydrolase family protein [Bacteroidaceae bacterium]
MNKKLLLCAIVWLVCGSLLAQTTWFNPMEGDEPYICGRAWNTEIGKSFARMPERFKATIPRSVWGLSRQSAGLMVRFRTNSPTIQVKYKIAREGGYKNMAPLCHGGVDLYGTDANGNTHWIGNHMGWRYADTITVTFKEIKAPTFPHRGLEYQLYLPPYSETTSLQIGVDDGTDFVFLPQSPERPIVVYGSSIVQGASPSRPGLMWTNILQRETDYPVVNLGFSGSALMEAPLFEAMSEIDARVFILDPMPNSHGLGEEIFKRMTWGVRKLREKSQAPILLVESSSTCDSVFKPDLYRKYRAGDAVLRKAYQHLLSEGVKHLYYLSHQELGLGEDSWIEGVHPNDLGNREYADAYKKKLKEILSEDTPNPRYMPTRQFRDGSYDWTLRHNEVMRQNRTADPEILMIGNSITHGWQWDASWEKMFRGRRVTNMGFGSDRIENVYWRIFHGELEGCKPSTICLQIGINNLAKGEREEDIAGGIVALSALIRQRQPQARLCVIKVYPCKGMEEKVARLNDCLQQLLPQDVHTVLLDANAVLLRKDNSGKIDETLFRDGVHPNGIGYKLLAKQLKEKILPK